MKSQIFMTAIAGLLLFMTGCGVAVYQHHGWHHHHRYYRDFVAVATVTPTLEAQSEELAADYGIKPETAQKIFYVMNSKTQIQDLANLNIDPRDLAPLAKMTMPSAASVHNVAAALGENDEAIAQLMADYINDLKNEINK